MKHLEEEYEFSKVDYKLFHPNLLRNHEYIILGILQLIHLLWQQRKNTLTK